MPPSKELPPNTARFFPNIFIRNQFLTKPQLPPSDTDLSGQVAVVTGSNTGLGLECARQLLSYQLSRLVLAVRTPAKGEAAAKRLKALHPGAAIDVWALDMASYESVQAFSARAERELARLDIVILNAGLGKLKFGTVPSTGHEETVQVNYYSTMLLSILLLPVLKHKSPAGTPGRLTIVTSMLSMAAKFPQKDAVPLLPSFDDERTFDARDAYPTSKLLGQLFFWKLTDAVAAEDVVLNMVEPGWVKSTELQRDLGGVAKLVLDLLKVICCRSVEVGVATYIDAVAVKGKESHGGILMNWDIVPYPALQYTPKGKEIMERLWQETLKEFSFIDVNGILESL